MVRRLPLLLAAVVAVTALALPSPIAGTARAAGGDIVPGFVNRSSPLLDATYDVYLWLGWGSRKVYVNSLATIRNTSGSPIDRVELNTVAARLGAIRLEPVTVDGRAVAVRISDQTIVVPLGGVLPPGGTTRVRVRYHATLRSSVTGSNWLFTRANGVADLYRWLPWVSRRIAFDRPNHGDPFETATSRSVKVRIVTTQKLVLATTGDRVSVSRDGLTQTFAASDVRDFTVTAATDFKKASRVVRDTVVRVYYRAGAPGAAMLDAAADAFDALERRLGSYRGRGW